MSKRADLKELLRRRAAVARERALDNDGHVPAEETANLERLARLVEVLRATEPPAKRPRWPALLVLAATLGLMSVLLFVRVPSTSVEIDLEVDQLGLVVSRSQTLSAAIPLERIGVAGLASLRMPRTRDSDGQAHSAADKDWPQIQLSFSKRGPGRMTLDPLTPPAETRVWLGKAGPSSDFGLSLKHEEIVVKLTLSGWLTLGSLDAPKFERNFGRGKSMHLMGRGKLLDVAMTLAEGTEAAFVRVIPVNALSLVKIHPDRVGESPVEESTIRAGTIYFVDLGDSSRALRTAEMLRLELSEGQVRALSLAGDHISLSFRGAVTSLTTGEGSDRRSLMPTYLEWLSAQHALSLFWGAAMYVFGLALAIMRWWRIMI